MLVCVTKPFARLPLGSALTIASLLGAFVYAAAIAHPRAYAVKNSGTLHLNIPAEWSYREGSSGFWNLADFSLPDTTGIVKFTIFPHPDRERGHTTKDLYSGTVRALKAAKRDPKGSKVKMSKISGRGNKGYLLSFMTSQPENPGLNYHVQGAVVVERLSLNFVAELNAPDDEIVETLLDILRTADLIPMTIYVLSLPDAGWEVLVDVRGFTIEDKATQAHLQATSNESGLVISAFLEPGHPGASSVDCRDHYVAKLSNSPVLMSEQLQFEQGPMALHEYKIEKYQGVRVRQMNIHGYLAHSDVCVELHVSKLNYRERQRDELLMVLQSAKVVER